MKTKIGVLITHPIQYFQPVFEELSASYELSTKVFFGCKAGLEEFYDEEFGKVIKWDSGPTKGFRSTFISENAEINRLRGMQGIWLGIKAAQEIRKWQADSVLIFAYTPTFITAATIWLKLTGQKSLILRADATDGAFKRGALKRLGRSLILPLYYSLFSFVLPIGSESDKHFSKKGVKARRRKKVLFSSNTNFFEQKILEIKKLNGAEESRSKQIVAYIGKLSRRKGVQVLVDAIKGMASSEAKKIHLVIVGSGELENNIGEQLAGIRKLEFTMTGFKNQNEIADYYAMADTVVVPSVEGETWGLVVNEALQFGCRVIATKRVGASSDLLLTQPHVVVESDDAKAIRTALNEYYLKPADWMYNKKRYENLPKPSDLVNEVRKYLERKKKAMPELFLKL